MLFTDREKKPRLCTLYCYEKKYTYNVQSYFDFTFRRFPVAWDRCERRPLETDQNKSEKADELKLHIMQLLVVEDA